MRSLLLALAWLCPTVCMLHCRLGSSPAHRVNSPMFGMLCCRSIGGWAFGQLRNSEALSREVSCGTVVAPTQRGSATGADPGVDAHRHRTLSIAASAARSCVGAPASVAWQGGGRGRGTTSSRGAHWFGFRACMHRLLPPRRGAIQGGTMPSKFIFADRCVSPLSVRERRHPREGRLSSRSTRMSQRVYGRFGSRSAQSLRTSVGSLVNSSQAERRSFGPPA